MKYDIRSMVEDDIPTILQYQQLLDNYHADIRPDLYRYGICNLTENDLNLEKRIIYVATVNSKVVGYTTAVSASYSTPSSVPSKFIHIEWLFVAEEYRGYGIASALLKRVIETTKLLGHNRVTFNVLEGNPALKLYKELGAATVSRQMEIQL